MSDVTVPLLRLDFEPAVALLLHIDMPDRDRRDRATVEALKRATGRTDIVLRRRESGRPALAPPYHELGVSIARREGLVLVGFAPDRQVGVDVDAGDAIPLAEGARLAADHFSPSEAQAIASLEPHTARNAFMRLWVAKEAALKTTGRGIFDGLDEPDLASHLVALDSHAPDIHLPASAKLPALRLTMAVAKAGSTHLICALAMAT